MATLRNVLNTGSSSNRVDVFFLGDGYTSGELSDKFTSDINAYISYLFDGTANTQPFGRYRNFFNFYAVDTPSVQSGADDVKAGISVDTALDAKYYWDGVTERLLYINESKADAALNSALAGTGIKAEMRYVLVNSTKYGGGGGRYGVYAAGNASAKEIALHEIGHSFAGLADEYGGNTGTYTGSEPTQDNITKDPTGAKWAEWKGYNDPVLGVVGSYQGGYYYDQGIYRPTQDSKMRSLGRPFDPIAKEEFIHGFYALVDPIDRYDDNSGVKLNVNRLNVSVIDPNVINVDWKVNGTTYGNAGGTFDLKSHGLYYGTYTVTARAYDPTDMVRGDRSDLEQSVSWTVTNYIADEGLVDFNGDGRSDILWRDTAGRISEWLTGSDGRIAAMATIGAVGSEWTVQDFGDFNGDGRADILWRDTAGHINQWLMGGDGRVTSAPNVGTVGAEWTVQGTGDFNGDGRSDILWRDQAGHINQWLTGSDGRVASSPNIGTVGAEWTVQDIGDFNGDGRSDILWRDTAGHVNQWLMGSDGRVASSPNIGTIGAEWTAIA